MSSPSIISGISVNPQLHCRINIGKKYECDMGDVVVLFETSADSTMN